MGFHGQKAAIWGRRLQPVRIIGASSKRILPITSSDEKPLSEEGIITLEGQDVGELRSHDGQYGLVLLHRKACAASGLMLGQQAITLNWPDWLPKDENTQQEKAS